MIEFKTHAFKELLAPGVPLRFAEEMQALFDEHWKEIALFKHILRLDIQIDRLLAIEEDGRLHVVTARDEQGKCCGYSIHVIARGMVHYQGVICAEEDVIYLTPQHRRTGAHADLRNYALDGLGQRGVQIVFARTKIGHGHDKALRSMGFEPFDLVYALDLAERESRRI